MDFRGYMNKLETPIDFISTGIDKSIYLDIMELALSAYPVDELEERICAYQEDIVTDIQAFSRITAAYAGLIANQRMREHYPLWEKMMDLCCRDLYRITDDQRADFAVKEVLIAYKTMKPFVSKEKLGEWAELLRRIDPYINYKYTIKSHEKEKLHNINIFNMLGEYLRESEGLTETSEYFNKHWPIQLERFDEFGMYKDPGCPMVYDLVTRGQIELLLAFGYRGEFYKQLDKHLESAGFFTLFMQSANGEFPFGGRSNQFLFNDAYAAAHCEYEAARYLKRGEQKLAGAYKRCAHLSIRSVLRWIRDIAPPKHIRNFYPVDDRLGEEPYAYYDKYMVTLAVNAYSAFLFAEDSIKEGLSPAEAGGYVLKPSESFHKIFANCRGNFIEIDTKADTNYDATGLGRYHKTGIPSEFMLSTPLTKTPRYKVFDEGRKENISICPGYHDGRGNIQYLSELSEGLETSLEIIKCEKDRVVFSIRYNGDAIIGCDAVLETHTIDKDGVHIKAELVNPVFDKIYYRIPLFSSNGKDAGIICEQSRHGVIIQSGDYKYEIKTNGSLAVEDTKYFNRNGEYKLGCIEVQGPVLSLDLNGYVSGS